MEIVQNTQNRRNEINNEVTSTSSEDIRPVMKKVYKSRYNEATSDSETSREPRRTIQPRSHYKSMGNINEAYKTSLQNSISVELTKKYDSLQIPIVGYEVMEERARFTIYKLKVEDDKSDQSWLVFRRYTDFVRLYSRIKAELPNVMLPLPGKRWFRDNFEAAFLEERVQGLQVFVNAILKKLPNHPVVREFFCLDEPPQVFSYQPEIQAVYGALEDSLTTLKMQLKQKDAMIAQLQNRLAQLEVGCSNCSTNSNTSP